MTEISLSEAADRIIDIETEAPFPKGTVHLFDNFDDPPLAAWFLPRDKTANARLYDLSDVVFDTHFQVLMKNGRRIPESRYMTSMDEYAVVAEAPERQITNDSAECLIIASNRSSNNYYHWMVQTLPGIDWAARTSRSGQIAILRAPFPHGSATAWPCSACQAFPLSLRKRRGNTGFTVHSSTILSLES